MQDAMEYLPRRRSQLAELGVTEDQLNKLQDLGGVPACQVTKHKDGEVRQHTELHNRSNYRTTSSSGLHESRCTRQGAYHHIWGKGNRPISRTSGMSQQWLML